jgi:hypothetical protein
VEKSPTPEDVAEARERARSDAERAFRSKSTKSVADEPPGDAGPYAFAPEALQAEYDQAYEERLEELRTST